MEADLEGGDWVLGAEFSLADIVLAPYFQTLLQYRWTKLYEDGFPRVTDWVARVTARESWRTAVARDFTDDTIIELNQQGGDAWPTILRHAS